MAKTKTTLNYINDPNFGLKNLEKLIPEISTEKYKYIKEHYNKQSVTISNLLYTIQNNFNNVGIDTQFILDEEDRYIELIGTYQNKKGQTVTDSIVKLKVDDNGIVTIEGVDIYDNLMIDDDGNFVDATVSFLSALAESSNIRRGNFKKNGHFYYHEHQGQFVTNTRKDAKKKVNTSFNGRGLTSEEANKVSQGKLNTLTHSTGVQNLKSRQASVDWSRNLEKMATQAANRIAGQLKRGQNDKEWNYEHQQAGRYLNSWFEEAAKTSPKDIDKFRKKAYQDPKLRKFLHDTGTVELFENTCNALLSLGFNDQPLSESQAGHSAGLMMNPKVFGAFMGVNKKDQTGQPVKSKKSHNKYRHTDQRFLMSSGEKAAGDDLGGSEYSSHVTATVESDTSKLVMKELQEEYKEAVEQEKKYRSGEQAVENMEKGFKKLKQKQQERLDNVLSKGVSFEEAENKRYEEKLASAELDYKNVHAKGYTDPTTGERVEFESPEAFFEYRKNQIEQSHQNRLKEIQAITNNKLLKEEEKQKLLLQRLEEENEAELDEFLNQYDPKRAEATVHRRYLKKYGIDMNSPVAPGVSDEGMAVAIEAIDDLESTIIEQKKFSKQQVSKAVTRIKESLSKEELEKTTDEELIQKAILQMVNAKLLRDEYAPISLDQLEYDQTDKGGYKVNYQLNMSSHKNAKMGNPLGIGRWTKSTTTIAYIERLIHKQAKENAINDYLAKQAEQMAAKNLLGQGIKETDTDYKDKLKEETKQVLASFNSQDREKAIQNIDWNTFEKKFHDKYYYADDDLDVEKRGQFKVTAIKGYVGSLKNDQKLYDFIIGPYTYAFNELFRQKLLEIKKLDPNKSEEDIQKEAYQIAKEQWDASVDNIPGLNKKEKNTLKKLLFMKDGELLYNTDSKLDKFSREHSRDVLKGIDNFIRTITGEGVFTFNDDGSVGVNQDALLDTGYAAMPTRLYAGKVRTGHYERDIALEKAKYIQDPEQREAYIRMTMAQTEHTPISNTEYQKIKQDIQNRANFDFMAQAKQEEIIKNAGNGAVILDINDIKDMEQASWDEAGNTASIEDEENSVELYIAQQKQARYNALLEQTERKVKSLGLRNGSRYTNNYNKLLSQYSEEQLASLGITKESATNLETVIPLLTQLDTGIGSAKDIKVYIDTHTSKEHTVDNKHLVGGHYVEISDISVHDEDGIMVLDDPTAAKGLYSTMNVANSYYESNEEKARALGRSIYNAEQQQIESYEDKDLAGFSKHDKYEHLSGQELYAKSMDSLNAAYGESYLNTKTLRYILSRKENEDEEGHLKATMGLYEATYGKDAFTTKNGDINWKKVNKWADEHNIRKQGEDESETDYKSRLLEELLIEAAKTGEHDLIADLARNPQNTILAGLKGKIRVSDSVAENAISGNDAWIKALKGDFDGDKIILLFGADGNLVGVQSVKDIKNYHLARKALARQDLAVINSLKNQSNGSKLDTRSKRENYGIANITPEALEALKLKEETIKRSIDAKIKKDEVTGLFGDTRQVITQNLNKLVGNNPNLNTFRNIMSSLLARPEQDAISSKHLTSVIANEAKREEYLKLGFIEQNQQGEWVPTDKYTKLTDTLLTKVGNGKSWSTEAGRNEILQLMTYLGIINAESGEAIADDQHFFVDLFRGKLSPKDIQEMLGGDKAKWQQFTNNGKAVFDKKSGEWTDANFGVFDIDWLRSALNNGFITLESVLPDFSYAQLTNRSGMPGKATTKLSEGITSASEKEVSEYRNEIGKDDLLEINKSLHLLINSINNINGTIGKANSTYEYKEFDVKAFDSALKNYAGGYREAPSSVANKAMASDYTNAYIDYDPIKDILLTGTEEEKQEILGKLTEQERGSALSTNRGNIFHKYQELQGLLPDIENKLGVKLDFNNSSAESWTQARNKLDSLISSANSPEEIEQLENYKELLFGEANRDLNENGGYFTQLDNYLKLANTLGQTPFDVANAYKNMNKALSKGGFNVVTTEQALTGMGPRGLMAGFMDALVKGKTDVGYRDFAGNLVGKDEKDIYYALDFKTHVGGVPLAKDYFQAFTYLNMLNQNKALLENTGEFDKDKALSYEEFQQRLAKGDEKYEGLKKAGADKWSEEFYNQFVARIKGEALAGVLVPVTDEEGNVRVFSVDEHSLINNKKLAAILQKRDGEVTKEEQDYLKSFAIERRDLAQGNLAKIFGSENQEKVTFTLKEQLDLWKDILKVQTQIAKLDINDPKYNEKLALLTEQKEMYEKEYQESVAQGQKALDKMSPEEQKKTTEELEKRKRELEIQEELVRLNTKTKPNRGIFGLGDGNIFQQLEQGIKQGLSSRIQRMFSGWTIIAKITQAFNQLKQQAIQLDKVMTNLRIVTGDNRKEAKELMLGYSQLAMTLGTTTAEITESATAWLRQGYEAAQVNDLVTASTYLSRLGMISMQEATKDLTSSLKGFKLEATDAMSVVDKLTALDVKAATTAGDIATALSEFANLANLSGVNIDQASAMAATIMDVSQNSGSQVGNSLKMIMSRYSNVKSGKFNPEEGEGDTEGLNEVESVLNKIGISLRTSNKEFREFDDVLEDIASKWDNLDNVSQQAIATALAGTRQREAFLVIMQNMDKYHELLQVSMESEATAERKYLSYQEQYEAAQKRVTAAWQELALNNDINKFLTYVTDVTGKLIKWLPEILKWFLRIRTTLNAYKIWPLLKNFGSFMGLPIQGLKQVGGQSGLQRLFTTEGYMKRSASYDPKLRVSTQISSDVAAIKNILLGQKSGLKTLNTNANDPTVTSANLADGVAVKYDTFDGSTKNLKRTKNGSFDKRTKAFKEWNKRNSTLFNNTDGTILTDTKLADVEYGIDAEKIAIKTAKTQMAAAAGISAALTANKSVTKDGVEYQKSDSANAASALISGSITAGLTAAMGPAGAILGPIIGNFIGDEISKIIDSDNIARKERVKQANDIISTMGNIKSNISEIATSVKNIEGWTSTDWAQYNEQIDQLITQLSSAEDKQSAEIFRSSLLNILGTLDQDFVTTGLNSQSTLEEILNAYRSSDAELLSQALSIAQQKVTTDQYLASQEDKIFEIRESLSDLNKSQDNIGWRRFWARVKSDINPRNTLKDDIFAGDQAVQHEQERIDTELRYYKNQLESIYTDEFKGQLQTAILSGKLGDTNILFGSASQAALNNYSLSEIQKMIVDEAINNSEIKDELADRYYDKNGNLTGSAIELVTSYMRANDSLLKYIQGDALTVRAAVERYKNAANDTQRSDYYGILETLAQSMGITVDQLLNNPDIIDKWGNLTQADFLMGSKEIEARLEKINNNIKNIVSGTTSVKATMKQILSDFPQLIIHSNSVTDTISGLLEITQQLAKLDIDKQFSTLMTNESLYTTKDKKTGKSYQDQVTELLKDRLAQFYPSLSWEEFIKDVNFESVKTLQGLSEWIVQYSAQFPELTKELAEYETELLANVNFVSDAYDQIMEQAKEYQTTVLQKEIDNLNAQKEAIGEITKQREYENKLIEARIKLENAQKEKKRIWRAGIGWTYESDQAAIAAAQEQLTEVSNEKIISKLELQIQTLEDIKKTIEDIPNKKHFEELQEAVTTINKDLFGGSSNFWSSDSWSKIFANFSNYVPNGVENAADKFNQAVNTGVTNKDKDIADINQAYNDFRKTTQNLGANQYKERKAAYDTFTNTYDEVMGRKNVSFGDLNENVQNLINSASEYDIPEEYGDYLRFAAPDGKSVNLHSAKIGAVTTLKRSDFFNNTTIDYFSESDGVLSGLRTAKNIGSLEDLKEIVLDNADGAIVHLKNGDRQGWYYIDSEGHAHELNDKVQHLDKDAYSVLQSRGYVHTGKYTGLASDFGFASGTLDSGYKGLHLLNELGSEAVVTPQGTLTALPAHSGVIPADITKNLWELGELSPTISRLINKFNNDLIKGDSNFGVSTDESVNINALTVNMTAQNGFDPDDFVSELKHRVALTRHNSGL